MTERRALDDLKPGEQVRMYSPAARMWLHGVVEESTETISATTESGLVVAGGRFFVAWINRPGYATVLPNVWVERGWKGWTGVEEKT